MSAARSRGSMTSSAAKPATPSRATNSSRSSAATRRANWPRPCEKDFAGERRRAASHPARPPRNRRGHPQGRRSQGAVARHQAPGRALQARQLQRRRQRKDPRAHDQRAHADRGELSLRGRGRSGQDHGQRDRELQQIESEAYRKVQEIQGKADAEATEIYAKAYNNSPRQPSSTSSSRRWRATRKSCSATRASCSQRTANFSAC